MASYAMLTNVGRNKEAAALANGTALDIAEIAWGDGTRIPAGGETTLQNEQGRKPLAAQGVTAGALNTAFFEVLIGENEGPFVIREAGLFDVDGAMIAIAYYDPPVNKPLNTVSAHLRINVVFSDLQNLIIKIDASTAFVSAQRKVTAGTGLTGGGDLSADRNFAVSFATQAEGLAGTRTDKTMSPLRVAEAITQAIDALVAGAPGALDTLQELATALGDNDDAIAALTASIATKLNSSAYTAADILAKLITVDGAGSGLDADKLDGKEASAFVETPRAITAGTGLTGGGNLSADRTISASIATQAEAEAGLIATKLMTPQRVAQAIAAMASTPPIASQAEASAGTDNTKMMTPLRVMDALLKSSGLVGSYTLASVTGTGTGTTTGGHNYMYAGSDLMPAAISFDTSSKAATGYTFPVAPFSGTWRALGVGPYGSSAPSNDPTKDYITLFQRIA